MSTYTDGQNCTLVLVVSNDITCHLAMLLVFVRIYNCVFTDVFSTAVFIDEFLNFCDLFIF